MYYLIMNERVSYSVNYAFYLYYNLHYPKMEMQGVTGNHEITVCRIV